MKLVLEQILLIKIIWYVNFHIQKLAYLQSCIELIQVQIIYIYIYIYTHTHIFK